MHLKNMILYVLFKKKYLSFYLNGLFKIYAMQPARFETLASKIQKEMTLYENGGRRGDYLERIYSHLMTIKPTSVESGRAFSSAGNLVVKIRSRLNDGRTMFFKSPSSESQ